jgi:hypothetical protein
METARHSSLNVSTFWFICKIQEEWCAFSTQDIAARKEWEIQELTRILAIGVFWLSTRILAPKTKSLFGQRTVNQLAERNQLYDGL